MRSPQPLAIVLLFVGLLLLPTGALGRDSDGDGLRDAFERAGGLTSPRDADSDDDGVIDSEEDHDDDDLSALGEQRFGTDPARPDSDGDGTLDGFEDDEGDGRTNALVQHQRPVPRTLRPALSRARDDISRHAPKCGVGDSDGELNTCHFGDTKSEITVALMGDSKATMYLPPAIRVAKQEGWHLVTLLKGRCTPVLGTMARYQRRLDGGASCNHWRQAAFDWLRENEPDMIVLVFSDDYTLVDRADRKLNLPQELQALREGLTRTVVQLPAASKVVLLADAPKSRHNAVNCLQRDPSDMSACVTISTPLASRRVDATIKEAVLGAGGHYRTLKDRICPYKPCPLVQGDVLVYRDKGHLTVTFTRLLAPSLRAELAPLLTATVEPSPVPSEPASPLPDESGASPLPSEAPA